MDELLDALIELLESDEEIPDDVLDEIIAALEEEDRSEILATPLPTGSDLLWILSGENPKAFTEYLQTFPDPALNALARNPVALRNAIERLEHQITQPAGEVQDGVPKQQLNSSNIYGFQYNPRSGKLKVRFNSGSIYSYDGVPPQVFKIFQAGAVPAKTDGQNRWGAWWKGKQPSSGAAFHELIRDRYPYRKVA